MGTIIKQSQSKPSAYTHTPTHHVRVTPPSLSFHPHHAQSQLDDGQDHASLDTLDTGRHRVTRHNSALHPIGVCYALHRPCCPAHPLHAWEIWSDDTTPHDTHNSVCPSDSRLSSGRMNGDRSQAGVVYFRSIRRGMWDMRTSIRVRVRWKDTDKPEKPLSASVFCLSSRLERPRGL